MTLALFGSMARPDRGVVRTSEVDDLLTAGAPVAIGVSGGKDSCALAFATVEHLDAVGHRGPRLLVHSDLGRVEWRDSAPTCARLSEALGLELLTVRRPSGDMMDRWLGRWDNNVARYTDLGCVKLILPWSTPAMRFCTSELKTDVICRALVRRFPGTTILSAVGIRREESPNRRKAPILSVQGKLQSVTHQTRGYNWNGILDFTLEDVLGLLEARRFRLHEGYTRFHSTRISCVYCMMGSLWDLAAAASCPDNHDIYREQVDLEIVSTFAFQGDRWLGDVAPHLLSEEQRAGLARAKVAAARRVRAEAAIPEHLLYEKGWPTRIPTWGEAVLLCDIRKEVADAVGLIVRYTDPAALIGRYEELYALARAA